MGWWDFGEESDGENGNVEIGGVAGARDVASIPCWRSC